MEREVECRLDGTQKRERGRERFVRCFFYGPAGHQLDTLNTEQKATSIFMLEMRCEEGASHRNVIVRYAEGARSRGAGLHRLTVSSRIAAVSAPTRPPQSTVLESQEPLDLRHTLRSR